MTNNNCNDHFESLFSNFEDDFDSFEVENLDKIIDEVCGTGQEDHAQLNEIKTGMSIPKDEPDLSGPPHGDLEEILNTSLASGNVMPVSPKSTLSPPAAALSSCSPNSCQNYATSDYSSQNYTSSNSGNSSGGDNSPNMSPNYNFTSNYSSQNMTFANQPLQTPRQPNNTITNTTSSTTLHNSQPIIVPTTQPYLTPQQPAATTFTHTSPQPAPIYTTVPVINNTTYNANNTTVRKISNKKPVNVRKVASYSKNVLSNDELSKAHENNSVVCIGNEKYKVVKTTKTDKFSTTNYIVQPKLEPKLEPTTTVYLEPNGPPIHAKPGQTIYIAKNGKVQQIEVPPIAQPVQTVSSWSMPICTSVAAPASTVIQIPTSTVSSTNSTGHTFNTNAVNILHKRTKTNNYNSNLDTSSFIDLDDVYYNSNEDECLLNFDSDGQESGLAGGRNSSPSEIGIKITKNAPGRPAKIKEITQEELELLKLEGNNPKDFQDAKKLNKHQEKILKSIRRKIRNKKSAHESRKRKKAFLETLQQQFDTVNEENKSLKTRIKVLEKENSALSTQVNKLKAFIAAASQRTAQATTCVMLLVLSLAFFLAPKSGPLSILDGKSAMNYKMKLQKLQDSYSNNENKGADGSNTFLSRRILSLYDADGNELKDAIINEPTFEELHFGNLDNKPVGSDSSSGRASLGSNLDEMQENEDNFKEKQKAENIKVKEESKNLKRKRSVGGTGEESDDGINLSEKSDSSNVPIAEKNIKLELDLELSENGADVDEQDETATIRINDLENQKSETSHKFNVKLSDNLSSALKYKNLMFKTVFGGDSFDVKNGTDNSVPDLGLGLDEKLKQTANSKIMSNLAYRKDL